MVTNKKKPAPRAVRVIKARAAEPSTWAGVAAVSQALAVAFPQYAAALGVLTAIGGAVAIAQREKSGETLP